MIRMPSMSNEPIAVVLAAGKGTRMKSELPKVMFPVLGRAMIHWVLDALNAAGIQQTIVVIGYRGDDVRRELAGRRGVTFALQTQQLGTGHAVEMCREQLARHAGPVLVVAGDSPLIQATSLRKLLQQFQSSDLACLLGTLLKEDPQGLGRIVRTPSGEFSRIVEHKDASLTERTIKEVNMSTYLFRAPDLLWALSKLENRNAQSEFYLTDCPQLLKADQRKVDALAVLEPCESLSINTIEELSIVEAKMRELGYATK
jgi:bifunctional UDP-N-acetylglucosamine pyrophosphorylase/glucosamine-1-phosphate N-acetyltransferase